MNLRRFEPTTRPARRSTFTRGVACAALAVFVLGACEARVGTRGNLPDPDLVAQLETGETRRNEVTQLLGSPSTIALFDFETWIYISERTETTAFFAPEVIDRKVLVVQFDEQGTLSSIQGLGLEDSHDIEPIERTTPTAGNEVTILDQILGNIGRFNTPAKSNPGF